MAFKQTLLSQNQLAQGLLVLVDDASIYYEALALIGLRASELKARLPDITFQATFDGLDELLVAVLTLPDGSGVTLKEYKGRPVPGVSVYTDREGSWSLDRLANLLRELDLSPTDITWARPWEAASIDDGDVNQT